MIAMHVFKRIFFKMVLPYGMMMGLCTFLINILVWKAHPALALISALVIALTSGLVFGVLMAIILGRWHIASVERITQIRTPETYGVLHTRTISLPIPYRQAFDLCRAALSVLQSASVQEDDIAVGNIQVVTDGSWKSWGEIITFQVRSQGEELTNIMVTSRPKRAFQFIDYATNLDNVQRIISFIESMTGLLHRKGDDTDALLPQARQHPA